MKSTPKGMRDFLPEDMIIRNEVVSRIESVYRSYGYRPLETPAMEYLDTLRAKAGGEVEGEIFTLEGKELGLRFDLTVPLARVAATNAFPKPFKRYQISRVWRREEPQRGRFREFWQADVDIIGSASMRCEAELLTLTRSVLSDFGFQKPKFMLNNRSILDALAEKLDITGAKKAEMFRLLDKWDKMGRDAVIAEMEKAVGGKTTEQLFDYVKGVKGNEESLEAAAKLSKQGADELRKITELCDFELSIDLSLVRGLGYYTGPVFEVKLAENMGSIAGGGRYDNLLSLYGQQDYATGISIGVERLITLMAERRKDGTGKKTYTRVFVAAVKPEFFTYAQKVAAEFRLLGIEAEVDLNERKLRQQLEYANVLSIPYIAVVGEREMKEGKVSLKDMASGKDELLAVAAAAKKVASE